MVEFVDVNKKMISGELFQSLAQISLCTDVPEIIVNQTRSMPQRLALIDETSVNDIKNYNIIYVYTQFLDHFFNKFYEHLADNTIIITHNSDFAVEQKHLKYLDDNTIKAWYCQNREVYHEKLFSLPIGLANSQWPHGNQQLITNIRDRSNIKEYLVYKNFDINTNTYERTTCHYITQQNNIPLSTHTTIENYWTVLSKSMFVISPPGNGIDCHRIWEALFLRTVPVVKYHEAFSQFKHLPILFVNSWDEITIPFLKEKSEDYINKPEMFNIPLLDIDYWKQLIV